MTVTEGNVLADQEQRDRIEHSLDETLFVEASAGTGKTTALVSRVVSLIAEGRATVDQVAAITFTAAAAAELRDRVRQGLENRARDGDATDVARRRCETAAGALERGAFQTIHSFAASILRERPLEAGLPPGFDTSDEITADLRFERTWRDWLENALDSEDAAPGLARFLRLGLPLSMSRLEEVARAFHANYDLLAQPLELGDAAAGDGEIESMAAEGLFVERLLTFAKNGDDDPLAAHGRNVALLCAELGQGPENDEANTRRLVRFGKISFTRGRQPDWYDDPHTGVNACKTLKETLRDLDTSRNAYLTRRVRSAVNGLLEELRTFVLDYAKSRKQEGRAEFHDLLIWARGLLGANERAREHFFDRYRYVLIDEFQDTDPIQSEIALLLTGGGSDGRLFIVGDPKQSIYRFRRADIEAVKDLRDRLGAGLAPLTQNFRCQEPIVEWVNSIFGRWMGREPSLVQAEYQELRARWIPPECSPPMGVHWFGDECENAPAMRHAEAWATASALWRIRNDRWQIRDGNGGLRDAQYRDVCVLMPTRSALREMEDELSDADIPYRIESQSTVLSSQDVRELISCLRAIDSPADEVAIVGALRSSAFACSDADLLSFIDAGGKFSYTWPNGGEGPVSAALATLSRFHNDRIWQQADFLIERFVRERRMIELTFDRRRPRERWRRLRFVIERARTFAATTGGGLRDFLDWIERQASEDARVVETPVPETDEDAVRIMTVHAAKGLEFPIVVLTGLGSMSRGGAGPVVFDRGAGAVEVSLRSDNSLTLQTAGYEARKEAENQAGEAERVRLMYVAATRARDHLIVSTFRNAKVKGSSAGRIVELAQDVPGLWREVPGIDGVPLPVQTHQVRRVLSSPGHSERARWLEDREKVIQQASVGHAVAASSLAREPDYEDPEREPSPGRRGRAGTSIGSAVHAVLQAVDLTDGRGVSELSRVHAEAEGVSAHTDEVERLSLRAVRSGVVRRAVASGRVYREIYAAAPVGERALEGFVDLCFVENGALVIVDFKTDAVTDENAEPIALKYRTQVGAYALALSRSTGMPVKQAILLFLQREPMAEVFEDVDALVAEAEAAVLAAP